MECCNYNECNRKLLKIMKKIENEIIKVDRFLQEYTINDKAICYNPTKDEKKQIINKMKAKSETLSELITELKVHRIEIKNLLKCFNTLFSNYRKLKIRQGIQLDKIESIYFYIKNDLQQLVNNRKERNHDLDKFEKQKQKDLELQKPFEVIVLEHKYLSEKFKEENKNITDHLHCIMEDNKRDQKLYSYIIKNIRKIFYLIAKLDGRQVKFINYAFPETKNNIDEHIGSCYCKNEEEEKETNYCTII